MDNVILHKEIDLIQTCITRMANNSFLLKGWTISIIAVVLALADKTIEPALLSAILLIPLYSFWYLDAFFLRTERMYRKLYEWVLASRSKDDNSFLYDLNPRRFEKEVESEWDIMWSITLRWFYGVPALITLGVILFRITRACLQKGI
ncbi:MAG: hypothetical protein EPO24_08360 [Bacteroidetes bacterium]|nr:MAG: hypothetical protein EPO24_08360 [Bacteroidota bacterium]